LFSFPFQYLSIRTFITILEVQDVLSRDLYNYLFEVYCLGHSPIARDPANYLWEFAVML